MKRIVLTLTLAVALWGAAFAQEDLAGCKDPPMFPNRMSNYYITECTSSFDAVDFNVAAGGAKIETREGNKTSIRYDFNPESGQEKPSVLQILRNYENAAKKIGGTTLFLNSGEAIGVFKIMKDGKDAAWVKVECEGNDNNDVYRLTVVQMEAMKQEIASEDILKALNTEGHIALYINFETGKAAIKTESQKTIDQIVQMLKDNPSLNITIEGHTDNVGTLKSNQTLSENRAKAVMNAIIAQGIDKTRLASKGWGQSKPIADNSTEEGRAKNRRVEIVKP
jgi:outer membrane protein OmpA-like peptidoglycan-associated protein